MIEKLGRNEEYICIDSNDIKIYANSDLGAGGIVSGCYIGYEAIQVTDRAFALKKKNNCASYLIPMDSNIEQVCGCEVYDSGNEKFIVVPWGGYAIVNYNQRRRYVDHTGEYQLPPIEIEKVLSE